MFETSEIVKIPTYPKIDNSVYSEDTNDILCHFHKNDHIHREVSSKQNAEDIINRKTIVIIIEIYTHSHIFFEKAFYVVSVVGLLIEDLADLATPIDF